MNFWNNITGATFIEEEIVHFEIYELGYYAITLGGVRLDITRAFHIQPPIENTQNYSAFMFAETQQGFFLLRQRVLEGRVGPWEVYMKVTACEPHRFYNDAYSYWWKVGERFQNNYCVDGSDSH